MDDELDDILREIEEDEELDIKPECLRCGSRFWEAARFEESVVIKCTDCPSDFDIH